MTSPSATSQANPFPGLRPFREDEEHLFFGRENQVDAMVNKLAATRFLAVVGTSGSGKSSLVNCGLMPALRQGLMAPAGTAWRIAKFRPGSDPIGAMARALAQEGVLFRDRAAAGLPLVEIVAATLRMSKIGLVDIYEQAALGDGVNLLVVVDQFEELFRYRQLEATGRGDARSLSGDAAAFVNLLLEVREQTALPIFVVLTMRSDFLGDCTQFPGLAEAINAGQYLVPRMTRDERRAAIDGPVLVSATEISPVLVTRLVNDVGDNPDQLSILQHALNRTWANWQHQGGGRGSLDLAHYEAIGTMAHALDQHAEKAFAELTTTHQRRVCEKIFKALTDKATDARGIRRPTRLGTLCALADATAAEVTEVMDVFRKPSRSFLMPPAGDSIDAETVVDISHESLMRVWQRLDAWADEDARSAQMYRRLAETAALHAAGKASLWRDPDLQLVLDWREANQPNETWASRYHPGFAAAMQFLTGSREARDAERAEREAQRQRVRQAEQEKAETQARYARLMRRRALFSSALALAAIVASIAAVVQWQRSRAAAAEAFWQAGVGTRDRDGVAAAHNFLRAAQLSGGPQQKSLELAAELATSGLVRSLPKGLGFVRVSNDGSHVLSWRSDGELKTGPGDVDTLTLWDMNTLALQEVKNEGRVTQAVVAPGGGRVVFWGADGGVKVWDVQRATPLHAWTDTSINGAVFSPDGSRVLSWDFDNVVKLWDVKTSEFLLEWTHGSVLGAAFAPDGSRVVSWSGDGVLKVRDATDARLLVEWKQATPVLGAAFAPDGRARIISWDPAGAVKLWDVTDAASAGSPPLMEWKHNSYVTGATFAPDGLLVLSWSKDGAVKWWDVSENKLLDEWEWEGDRPVDGAVFTADGSRVLFWSDQNDDGAVKVWDLKKALKRAWKQEQGVQGAVFASKGNVVSLGADGVVRRWDVEKAEVTPPWTIPPEVKPPSTGALEDAVLAPVKNPTGAVFAHDGSISLSWDEDGLKLWDSSKDGDPIESWTVSNGALKGAAFTTDDSRILAWGQGQNLHGFLALFDVAKSAPIVEWKPDEPIDGAVFNENESRVLTWSGVELTMWNAELGEEDRQPESRIRRLEICTATQLGSTGRLVELNVERWRESMEAFESGSSWAPGFLARRFPTIWPGASTPDLCR